MKRMKQLKWQQTYITTDNRQQTYIISKVKVTKVIYKIFQIYHQQHWPIPLFLLVINLWSCQSHYFFIGINPAQCYSILSVEISRGFKCRHGKASCIFKQVSLYLGHQWVSNSQHSAENPPVLSQGHGKHWIQPNQPMPGPNIETSKY